MDFLPLFADVKSRNCLVVGGGDIAARKVEILLRAGAQVKVIAPALCEVLAHRQAAGEIVWSKGVFKETQLDRMQLVVAATDDHQVNRRVSELAQARGLWVNVVDDPQLCSFIFPAIVDRSPVLAAVSSGGAAPVLARLLRARMESMIPAAYGLLARFVAAYRPQVKERLAKASARRRFWEDMLQGPIAERVLAGHEADAHAMMRSALESSAQHKRSGEVYLVGAGPGDPDLLTFRALRLMQQADVVLHDRLVSPKILDLVRREAERIYVGKRRAYHSVRQEEINRTIATLAKAGKRVLRLKGGDPLIFGRGGEEIETLAEQGIPFQIVPGITAASGCASYAGIPLTHRDYAQSVVFVTGHLQDGEFNLNWEGLIQPGQTIVIYMGLTGLRLLCQTLMGHGLNGDTPAALVEHGTLPDQRVLIGTLNTLPGIVAGAEVRAPTLMIVGDVVRLHSKLAWFAPGTSEDLTN